MNNPSVISTVSNQWATRPDDQRFLSLNELLTHVQRRRDRSASVDVATEHLQLTATESGEMQVSDERGAHGIMSHWSFGQLCQIAKAPAGYLRSLPAELARLPLSWSLEMAGRDDHKLLVRQGSETTPGALAEVDAITSGTYGRIWDADVVKAVTDRIGPEWKVPGASYAARDPKLASTLYASDRDVFLFLVDETRPIEVDGETMFRGFYTWNSEVGSATFGIATMLYQYVCDNRNIWGPKDFREIKIRHTSGGPHRFMYQAAPALRTYAQASSHGIETTVRAAMACEVAKDKAGVLSWLKAKGFTAPVAQKAYDAAEQDTKRKAPNPRTVWGLVQGLTQIAHDIKHTDERTDLERKAGALLDVVAA